ncbi:MAG: hypothetical protein C0418_04990, partial [Coriobacteriaceae bacterium]|nr:hypothetical protein [Coriobacteriaceae bacterium]
MPETLPNVRLPLPAAAALVAALGLASIAVPVAAGGAIVTLVGLVGAAALAAFAFLRAGMPARATWPALALLAAACAWMLLAAALSASPRVSLVGWI